jgi:hypothetical protein
MHKLLSHCLLFSVSPGSLFSLHLSGENKADTIDCGADKSKILDGTFFHTAPNSLKITAAKWGLVQKAQI